MADRAVIRFVLWNEERGIYLGREGKELAWTKTKPAFSDKAPTYSESSITMMIKDRKEFEDCEMRQCLPDHGSFATKDRCADSGLPRW